MATNNNNNQNPQFDPQLFQMYGTGQMPNPNNPNMNMNQFAFMNQFFGNMNNMNNINNQNTFFIPPNPNNFNNFNFNDFNQANFVNPEFQNQANMMNNNSNQNMGMDQGENWTLTFEKKPENNKLNIQISSSETVAKAFQKCREKLMLLDIPLTFTYNNGKQLDTKLTLSASGLKNGSVITVKEGKQNQNQNQNQQNQQQFQQQFQSQNQQQNQNQFQSNNSNQWNLLFENQANNSIFNIQVQPDELFEKAVAHYKNKILKDINAIYIFNSKTLDLQKTVRQQGISQGGKILVVETSSVIGAL